MTERERASRILGTVKWFDGKKGYGFIQPDGTDGSKETNVFVHYSAIVGHGYRELRDGQRVEFSLEQDRKGARAVEVVVLQAAA